MPWSPVEKEVRNRDTCEAKCLVLEKQLFGLNAAVFSLLSRVVPFSYRDLIYSLTISGARSNRDYRRLIGNFEYSINSVDLPLRDRFQIASY